MDKYDNLGTIGEGTYGVVMKCRNLATGQIVAIKKFKESDDDQQVRKTALREIKILQGFQNVNIIHLFEVFRRKGKLYLVFEYVEKTLLEEVEGHPEGLEEEYVKSLLFQLVTATARVHSANILHRDIKPENLLVSKAGVLKLCDFGFARTNAKIGQELTEYVSTRWYRAPELLVGDVSYGKGVDVWAIGCLLAEMTTDQPLFAGDSDMDQLHHIMQCRGDITSRQRSLFARNALYVGSSLPASSIVSTLEKRFPKMESCKMDFLRSSLEMDPLNRMTCAEMLLHPYLEPHTSHLQRDLTRKVAEDSKKRKKNGGKNRNEKTVDPWEMQPDLPEKPTSSHTEKKNILFSNQATKKITAPLNAAMKGLGLSYKTKTFSSPFKKESANNTLPSLAASVLPMLITPKSPPRSRKKSIPSRKTNILVPLKPLYKHRAHETPKKKQNHWKKENGYKNKARKVVKKYPTLPSDPPRKKWHSSQMGCYPGTSNVVRKRIPITWT